MNAILSATGQSITDNIDYDSIREEVDNFLISLPFDNNIPYIEEIEDAIYQKVFNTETRYRKLQCKIKQWVKVATELYKVIEEQQVYIDTLNESNLTLHNKQIKNMSFTSLMPNNEEITKINENMLKITEEITYLRNDINKNKVNNCALLPNEYFKNNEEIQKEREMQLNREIEEKNVEIEEMKRHSQKMMDEILEIEKNVQSQEYQFKIKENEKNEEIRHLNEVMMKLKEEIILFEEREENSKIEIKELIEQNKIHEMKLNENLNEKCKTYENEILKLKENIMEKNLEGNELRSNIENKEIRIKELEHQNVISNAKIKKYEDLCNAQKRSINEIEKELDEKRNDILKLKETLNNEKINIRSLKNKLETCMNKMKTIEKSEAELKITNEEKIKELNEVKTELYEVKTKKTEIQKAKKELEEILKKENSELELYKKEIEELNKKMNSKEIEISELKEIEKEYISDNQKLKNENKVLNEKIKCSEILISDLESKIEDIRKSEDNSGTEQISSSIKRLQTLLYNREKELRRSQLKTTELQTKLSFYESINNSKNEDMDKQKSHYFDKNLIKKFNKDFNITSSDSE